jgi:hypothetical protein
VRQPCFPDRGLSACAILSAAAGAFSAASCESGKAVSGCRAGSYCRISQHPLFQQASLSLLPGQSSRHQCAAKQKIWLAFMNKSKH